MQAAGSTATPLTAQLAFRSSVLEAMWEAVGEGMLLVSPDGEILAYNHRFAQLWDFDEDLLARRSDEAALNEAVQRLVDPEAFLERVRYLYEHPDESSTDELRFRDGMVLERYSAPVRGSDGTPYGRLWSFRDVTHARETEHSLARTAAEQAALYRFTDELHHADSLDDVYEAAIEAIMAALGCDRASLLQFDEHDFMGFVASRGLSDEYRVAVNGHTPWTPDQVDAEPIAVDDIRASDLDDALKETVLGEGIQAFAFIPLVGAHRLLGKFMVYYDAPHTFTEGELALALTVARQIAFGIERRHADEERERAQRAVRDADRRKDEFLAMLAHELRNPLAAMHNALPLLEAKVAAGEDASRLFGILDRQTARLGRLVDDLMDVSRITRGHVELRQAEIDLVPVVHRALEAAAEQAGAEDLELEIDLPDEPVHLYGDAVRLEQVVHNLVANAIKYTGPGGRVRVVLAPAPDEGVELRVIDTGIGIAPEFLGDVFGLFHQADRSLDRAQGGLGIGLTVARQLVELHGGTIEARSPGLGAGSEFVVRLPRSQPPPATPRSEPVVSPQSTPKRRVLLVDDSKDQVDVLGELIEHLGHTAIVTHDSERVLELVSRERPDIVLLDIGLPGRSGYDIARELRSEPANASILLVALTGYGQPADRKRSAEAGFDAHIVKPISIETLEHMLETRSPPPTLAGSDAPIGR